jgi:hypothetical protein
MPMKKAVLSMALLAAAFACSAEWKSIRRDTNAMLSVDAQSIKRKDDEVSLRYLVDFRAPQGNPRGGETPYRSIVVTARVNCKNRTIALVNTDAYGQFSGAGVVIAKTGPGPSQASFMPLESDSSDEDVWRHVCLESKAPLKSGAKNGPAKKEPAKK